MKKNYIEPKMAIIEIDSTDIIATSPGSGGGTSGSIEPAGGMEEE